MAERSAGFSAARALRAREIIKSFTRWLRRKSPQPLLRSLLALHGRGTRLRIHYKCVHFAMRNRLSPRPITGNHPIVVSLTSYGPRLSTVFLAVESIAYGRALPSRIILWVNRDEIDRLPASLHRLTLRGLEVRPCEDWGPHTKYYPYSVELAENEHVLVTADDDCLYPRWWLDGIVQRTTSQPDVIWCYRAHRVALNPDGSTVAPYLDWTPCTTTAPSFAHFATGVSGVAYPPKFVLWLRTAGPGFTDSSPRNDDIWLHCQAVRCHVPVGQIHQSPLIFDPIPGTDGQALKNRNVFARENDRQIAATYGPVELAALKDTR